MKLKTFLLLFTAIILGWIMGTIIILRADASEQVLDNGMYKIEPTGCPYGDSIPVDSPKCVAPVEHPIPESPKPVETTQEVKSCQ